MLFKMEISSYLDSMFNQIKDLDTIVCASKYFTIDEIIKINHLGIQHFGENRVDALLNKQEALKDLKVHWHFIGHLQRNKVKDVISKIDVLHSLDSLLLAKEIQKYRKSPLDCFIQVNLTKETQKYGVLEENLNHFIKEIQKYDKINIVGLMCMGQLDDSDKTKEIFKKLNDLNISLGLKQLSMGMSHDYLLALPYHPRYMRIGSLFKGVI